MAEPVLYTPMGKVDGSRWEDFFPEKGSGRQPATIAVDVDPQDIDPPIPEGQEFAARVNPHDGWWDCTVKGPTLTREKCAAVLAHVNGCRPEDIQWAD